MKAFETLSVDGFEQGYRNSADHSRWKKNRCSIRLRLKMILTAYFP